jgi:TCP-1/cpn60 chaperonin family
VTAGISIVLRALEAPIRQIVENSGVEGSIVVGKLSDSKDHNQGFDAQNEIYVDMIKAGIVDPAKVVRTALQDAGSIAALLICESAWGSDADRRRISLILMELPGLFCHAGSQPARPKDTKSLAGFLLLSMSEHQQNH